MNWIRCSLLLLGMIWAWVGCADVTSGPNQPPVASAGADRGAGVGQVVRLNGSGSYDPDGDKLSFRWMLLSGPGAQEQELGSDVTLDFTPERVGPWLVGLIVNDGKLESEQDVALVRTYDCDDKDACTLDEYADGIGCTHTRVPSGSACGICRTCNAAGQCREDLSQNQDCPVCQVCAAAGQCINALVGNDLKKECTDSLFCNGLERCDGKGACQTNGVDPPCLGTSCDEVNDVCGCKVDSECPLCQWCSSGTCVTQQPGEDKKHECDDGLFCTQVDACDGAGACVHSGDPCSQGLICQKHCNEDVDNCFDLVDTVCDDGSFCNGGDTCDGVGNCSTHTGDPCANGGACNNYCRENPQGCFAPSGLACPDSTFCDGIEICNGQGTCQEIGQDPCQAPAHCDPGSDACIGCTTNNECPLCQYCDNNHQCVNQDAGQDLKNDCPPSPCHTGACDGHGVCGLLELGDGCDGGNGNLCDSTCDSWGACQAGVHRDCDDHIECTQDACAPATGICSHSNLPPGTPCAGSNNNYCDSTCNNSGGCDDSTGVVCLDDNNVCTVAVCNTASGLCTTSNAAPGTPCPGTDGNLCNHTCASGVCVDVPVVCEQSECHTNVCQGGGECKEDHVASGTGCMGTDADWCNSTCNGEGVCIDTSVVCDDHNPCTNDQCDTNNGFCSHEDRLDGALCDAGGSDYCSHTCLKLGAGQPSTCTGPAVACNDFKDCTNDSCNLADGACRYTEKAPGSPCDDAQSNIDRCQHTCVAGGNCTGPAVSCSDYPGCSSPVCDPGNGKCSYTLFPVGTPCAGSDAEQCNSSCNSTGDCDNATPAADDQSCQDPGGNTGVCCSQVCRVNWQCCTNGGCDDSNQCTSDTCPTGACQQGCIAANCMILDVQSPATVNQPAPVTIEMCPTSGAPRDINKFVCTSNRNQGEILLEEHFESGFGLFATLGPVTRQAAAQNPNTSGTGSLGVQLCGNGASTTSMSILIDTTGRFDIGLKFSVANRSSNGLGNGHLMAVDYTTDGGSVLNWRSLAMIGDGLPQRYQDYFLILPPDANNNANFGIRFFLHDIGIPNGECAYVDDVWLLDVLPLDEVQPLLAESFENGFGTFTEFDPEGNDVNLQVGTGSNTTQVVAIKDNAANPGANIFVTNVINTTGVNPYNYLVVSWDWKVIDYNNNNIPLGGYVFAEYSLNGDAGPWLQMSGTGNDHGPWDWVRTSAVLGCEATGITNLKIRFRSPNTAANNSSEGVLIDNIAIREIRPDWIDVFGVFTDLGNGTYTTTVTPQAQTPSSAPAVIICRYGCSGAVWSNSDSMVVNP